MSTLWKTYPYWSLLKTNRLEVHTESNIKLFDLSSFSFRYNVDSWLSLVDEARPKFHKQHMVMIELAKWLVPILCRGPGADLSQFPLDLVHTRLDLAISFLNVLDVVEPGLSKFRAKFMFEMIDTKMFLFCQKFKTGTADPSQLFGKKSFKEYSKTKS